MHREDGRAALSRATSIPDFQDPYLKARSHLLTNDYASSENGVSRSLAERALVGELSDFGPAISRTRNPLPLLSRPALRANQQTRSGH